MKKHHPQHTGKISFRKSVVTIQRSVDPPESRDTHSIHLSQIQQTLSITRVEGWFWQYQTFYRSAEKSASNSIVSTKALKEDETHKCEPVKSASISSLSVRDHVKFVNMFHQKFWKKIKPTNLNPASLT